MTVSLRALPRLQERDFIPAKATQSMQSSHNKAWITTHSFYQLTTEKSEVDQTNNPVSCQKKTTTKKQQQQKKQSKQG